tara:strand:+ start:811 stop:1053 length:243 start_codon:yes stop_codon:yes gene_type:complete
MLSVLETDQIAAHLGGGDHLHSLGNLTDVSNGLDTEGENLFVGSEVTLLGGHEHGGGIVLEVTGLGESSSAVFSEHILSS